MENVAGANVVRMENSFSYFCNKDCQFFPCHDITASENFNCLFCYCPLYRFNDCQGNYIIMSNGIKDCSRCFIPHNPDNYNFIVEKLIQGE